MGVNFVMPSRCPEGVAAFAKYESKCGMPPSIHFEGKDEVWRYSPLMGLHFIA
jgi:hypothetical protein